MKIAIIYFNKANIPDNRKHHEIHDYMLQTWVRTYQSSGTTLQPVILTDRSSTIPSFWPYEVQIIDQTEPPKTNDVLNKVGWMKGQAFEKVGRCLLMDLDAFIIKNIDEMASFQCALAMAPDVKPDHEWYKHFPGINFKHNAGVMIVNKSCWDRFQQLWHELWPTLGHITYFDEVLFNIMLSEDGVVLDQQYNTIVQESADINQIIQSSTKILHYPGRRKHLIKDLMRKYLI